MINEQKFKSYIDKIVTQALHEDLDELGDITSKAIFTTTDVASAVIRSKNSGILSGMYLIEPIFHKIDPNIQIELKCSDSSALQPGKIVAILNGPVNGILAGERTALNFLQRLSGIASLTSKYVNAIAHTKTKLLDTRKTTPGLRYLEKMAVVHGGGTNHRIGLFDMILIKDTHVKRSGGVSEALKKAIAYKSENQALKIEVEVQSIGEFHQAVKLNPDRIMLDNMSIGHMRECVEFLKKENLQIELEASGNITLNNISDVAETGVDFISSGSITHSASALDIHLTIA